MAQGGFTLLGGQIVPKYWYLGKNIEEPQQRGAAHLTTSGVNPHQKKRHPSQLVAQYNVTSSWCGGAALCGGVCAALRGQNEVLEMHLAPFLDTIFSGTFPLMEAFY